MRRKEFHVCLLFDEDDALKQGFQTGILWPVNIVFMTLNDLQNEQIPKK
jgi:hypothetical protein